MPYSKKIDWASGMSVLHFATNPIQSAVLGYHVQMEQWLNRIIAAHLKDPNPKVWDFSRISFEAKVSIARAMLGPLPDDDVWKTIAEFNRLRNSFAHGRIFGQNDGQERLGNHLKNLLREVRSLDPRVPVDADPTTVVQQAAHIANVFFMAINSHLGELYPPKP
jgi:hypothetical protein